MPFDLPKDNMFVGLKIISAESSRQSFLRHLVESVYHRGRSCSHYPVLFHVCMVYQPGEYMVDKLIYMLCLFAMVVLFQMEMYTLSKIANMLRLNTPWGLIFIYLGFGAGLAVFMFTGFMKSIPLEIEEAAMIDGCTQSRLFQGGSANLKPTCITVMILQAMWIWNDYLLPSLVLDTKKYRTIPIAVQYLKGGYGSVDMGAMMGALVLSIIPIVIFYLCCQKHIIEGVVAGAVKG